MSPKFSLERDLQKVVNTAILKKKELKFSSMLLRKSKNTLIVKLLYAKKAGKYGKIQNLMLPGIVVFAN